MGIAVPVDSGGRVSALPTFSYAQYPRGGRGTLSRSQMRPRRFDSIRYRAATTVIGSAQISL